MSDDFENESPQTLHDVDWNFRWNEEELLRNKSPVSDPEEEWPIWTVKSRFFEPDEHRRVYQLEWMHPVTWEMQFDTIPEASMFPHYERVDEEEAQELAEQLQEEADGAE